jgi:hypothetical protein
MLVALGLLALATPTAQPRAQDSIAESPVSRSEPQIIWRANGESLEINPVESGESLTFLQSVDRFSTDGAHVAILEEHVGAGYKLRVRDATDGSLLSETFYSEDTALGLYSYDVALSSTSLIAYGRLGGVFLYDAREPGVLLAALERNVAPHVPIDSVSFSRDGRLLAFQTSSSGPPSHRTEGYVYVVDLSTGKRVAKLEAVAGRAPRPSFSHDGKRLVATHWRWVDDGRFGHSEAHIRVWDTMTWELLRDIGGLDLPGRSMATGATRDAAVVTVYSVGDSIELRDLVDDRVLWSKPLLAATAESATRLLVSKSTMLQKTKLNYVSISDDGTRVVGYEGPDWIGDAKRAHPGHLTAGSIVVRDARDGSIMAAYEIPDVFDVAVSPDGAAFVYSVGFHQTYVALARMPR